MSYTIQLYVYKMYFLNNLLFLDRQERHSYSLDLHPTPKIDFLWISYAPFIG